MEKKDTQDTVEKSSIGLLIVEGGFEDQVCLYTRAIFAAGVFLKLIRDFGGIGWRIGIIP
jgi:hypothetical protein